MLLAGNVLLYGELDDELGLANMLDYIKRYTSTHGEETGLLIGQVREMTSNNTSSNIYLIGRPKTLLHKIERSLKSTARGIFL